MIQSSPSQNFDLSYQFISYLNQQPSLTYFSKIRSRLSGAFVLPFTELADALVHLIVATGKIILIGKTLPPYLIAVIKGGPSSAKKEIFLSHLSSSLIHTCLVVENLFSIALLPLICLVNPLYVQKIKYLIYNDLVNQEVRLKHEENFSSSLDSHLHRLSINQGDFLKKWKNKEAVTLFDAKPFLAYRFYSAAYGQELSNSQDYTSVYETLKKYYTDTHQREGFLELETSARLETFFSLLEHPTYFKKLNSYAASSVLPRQRQLYKSFCLETLQDIENKQKQHPSIHGHPRDLFNLKEKRILDSLTNKALYPEKMLDMEEVFQKATERFKAYKEAINRCNEELKTHADFFQELENTDVNLLISLPSEELKDDQLIFISKAQSIFLKIDLGPGRVAELTLLETEESIDLTYRQGLKKLSDLNKIRGTKLDKIQLQNLIQEHQNAFFHPHVVIEGAGPTGLLSAFLQFQAGAKVRIFEKRNMFYDRTQIVRLDPKWMSLLKFYLGEEYYKLFLDRNHLGVIREDGFGEVATCFLEHALHEILTLLISNLDSKKEVFPSFSLEKFAAYEIKDVIFERDSFKSVASYSHNQDPMKSDLNTSPDHASNTIQELREIDLLICTGGKSSPLKEKYLPSSIAVTERQNYGVCSWLSNHNQPHKNQNDKMTIFQDFRGVVHVDKSFRKRFEFNLNSFLSSHFLSESKLSLTEEYLAFIRFHLLEQENFKNFVEKGPLQPYIQTRTFENRGLVYIGMEIPSELKVVFDQWSQKLGELNVNLPQDEKNKNKNQQEKVLNYLHCIWFQTIAEAYKLDQSHGLSFNQIDKKFTTMFSVEQNRLHKDHFFSSINYKDKSLFIAAAGDANNSPHFMRYSGLTGAREDILGLQRWTKALAYKESLENKDKLKKELIENWERTSQFVISRGLAFLQPRSGEEISRQRKDKMIEILNKETEKSSSSYRLSKLDNSALYELVTGDKTFYLCPTSEGSLEMQGKKYESFAHLKLEHGF